MPGILSCFQTESVCRCSISCTRTASSVEVPQKTRTISAVFARRVIFIICVRAVSVSHIGIKHWFISSFLRSEKDISQTAAVSDLCTSQMAFKGKETLRKHCSLPSQGTPYNVKSPVIANYTANIKVVQGVMPDRDMYYLVIYTTEIVIDEYDTALGLGFIQMHVGVCYE